MTLLRTLTGFLLFSLLSSCASSPPDNPANICSMFEERRSWYKAAKRSERRWGVPVYVSMAFINQESGFQARAKPPRKRYFGFIPGPRPSSAFGYAQVLDETWAEYKGDAGNWSAQRSEFRDAIDFIGWYNNRSYQTNGINRNDAFSLYLAYHEGNGGFSRRSYEGKQWLLDVSQNVQARADSFRYQYEGCRKDLDKSWFMRLFS